MDEKNLNFLNCKVLHALHVLKNVFVIFLNIINTEGLKTLATVMDCSLLFDVSLFNKCTYVQYCTVYTITLYKKLAGCWNQPFEG